jgi:RimJ/RimL family protein N-acetyltransferase
MQRARAKQVTLAPYTPADAQALCEVDQDPEHQRRFEFPVDFTPSLQHSREVLARWERERRAGLRYPFAVRGAGGELLGGCEIEPLGRGAANVSYWTHPLHRGRGVASEALRQLCILGFGELGFSRIELAADADNLASRRIAERNAFRECGMRDGRVLYVRETGDQQAG